MEFTIENDRLRVTVTTWGAQVKSVKHKDDGVEHMWQADPEVWGKHAPILFPYTSRVKSGVLRAKGGEFPANIHGFAKDMEHSLVTQTENTVVLELTDSPETLALWPYSFRLVSTFTLEADTLHHTLTVENTADEQLRFGIGFHPAFAVPFDSDHQATDYYFGFDAVETPLCLNFGKSGRFGEETYYLGTNVHEIPLDEHLFDNDSHNMTALRSRTLGLYEKDTGRGVVCSIQGFPYVLIWSKPGMPRFVCIEPWHTPPCNEESWEDRPAAAILEPGESWSTTLSTAFVR